jgi:hypothetical protein
MIFVMRRASPAIHVRTLFRNAHRVRLSLSLIAVLALRALPENSLFAEDASPPSAEGEDVTRETAELVVKLGSSDVTDRDRATARLKALGDASVAALELGLKDSDPERAARCRLILRQIRRSHTRVLLETNTGVGWADVAGGAPRIIVKGRSAALSPDGTQLAFADMNYDRVEAGTLTIETGEIRSLKVDKTWGPNPLWDPKGERLCMVPLEYIAKQAGTLVIYDVKSGESKSCNVPDGESLNPFAWSSDGKRLYFQRSYSRSGREENGTHWGTTFTHLMRLTVETMQATQVSEVEVFTFSDQALMTSETDDLLVNMLSDPGHKYSGDLNIVNGDSGKNQPMNTGLEVQGGPAKSQDPDVFYFSASSLEDHRSVQSGLYSVHLKTGKVSRIASGKTFDRIHHIECVPETGDILASFSTTFGFYKASLIDPETGDETLLNPEGVHVSGAIYVPPARRR